MSRRISLISQAIGYFLILACLILVVAGISLFWPQTFWSQIWSFKEEEFRQMLPYRVLFGSGFWLLAIVMGMAAIGWFRRRRRGWLMTIGIFVVNGLSDGARMFSGSVLEGAIGVSVTSIIIYYLTRPAVRAEFN
ncbi:MAG: hypothetical protein Q8927_07505 [Bacteroidota bacterium]|nr:hypothetical protein [Bacteroidota bacterium]MDP4216033.1 hypothetical protein [Bacteroidota bacterium]MDP4247475.1 hypothetical protein [Bacteroidota bacterium]MDP4260867.1 hypothetical protein [Bacteroidota bacterium]